VGERQVEMSKSERASTLHSGWRPIYYVYKMLLSSWSMSSKRHRGPGSTPGSSPGSSHD
jgi:hypothetical protein